MNIDLRRLREDTRGVSKVIHLNNSGASLPPNVVVDAVVSHVRTEEEMGPYEAAALSTERAAALYTAAATLIGCTEQEIAFCDSASRAWNVLLYSLRLKKGDRILVSPLEFGSGLVALQHIAERSGATVEVLPADAEGRVLCNELYRTLSGKRPALVAITHAAAHSGSVNPINEIGAMVKDIGAFYVVDACQSVGQMQVCVDESNCDALTATGRKWLRGPRGTGFLYVRKTVSESIDPITSDLVSADYSLEPYHDTRSHLRIRSDARKFELWERNVAAAIGFGVAIEYLLELISNYGEAIYERIVSLAQYTAERLREINHVDVWAPPRAQSGVVGFLPRDHDAAALKAACFKAGINISTMSKWDAPLDFERRGASTVCRVAPHYFNDLGEIDRFVEVVRDCALNRSISLPSAT